MDLDFLCTFATRMVASTRPLMILQVKKLEFSLIIYLREMLSPLSLFFLGNDYWSRIGFGIVPEYRRRHDERN